MKDCELRKFDLIEYQLLNMLKGNELLLPSTVERFLINKTYQKFSKFSKKFLNVSKNFLNFVNILNFSASYIYIYISK